MSRRTLGRRNWGLSGAWKSIIESLESRRLLATVTVTNASDTINGNTTSIATLLANNGGDGISLREALIATNQTANSGGPDVINFQIPGVGVHTIPVLPGFGGSLTLTDPVTIDATTESDYGGLPRIEINGGDFGMEAFIIEMSASGSTLRGMAINRSSSGILIRSSNNVVEACVIGLDAGGTIARPNTVAGIRISDTAGSAVNNRIGGTTAAQRNVISASPIGISISATVTLLSGNLVQGNYIGTNAAGTADLGNTNYGVSLSGPSAGNTIGGDAAGAGNLISGNDGVGVYLSGPGAAGNWVAGNFIGTNAAGTAALANGTGVLLDGAESNTIGYTTAAGRNVISGNSQDGVRMVNANGTFVENNYIGTNAAGTAALANGDYGVEANGTFNRIGTPGAGNVISGNPTGGVLLDGANNTAQGNIIGLNAAGTAAIPNPVGLRARNGSSTIGGTAAGAGNVISGNSTNGIIVEATAPGSTVQGNFVGTNAAGTAVVQNGNFGVQVLAVNTLIGGAVAGARNVISGNFNEGLVLTSANGSTISGNYIGTNAAGTAALANVSGIALTNTANCLIGGTTALERNVISGNIIYGFYVSGGASTGNRIQGNYIGTDATGSAAVGNHIGVIVLAPLNIIGGATAAERNVISGNVSDGVQILNNSTSNRVEGNYIGINAAGTAALGNFRGLYVADSSSTIIGGSAAGAGNIISGNRDHGIMLQDSVVTGDVAGCLVLGNRIGTNPAGTLALGNIGDGILVSVNVLPGSASNTRIGGPTPGERNVISANRLHGIEVVSAEFLEIQGNFIGTQADGISPLGNARHGVYLQLGSARNRIGRLLTNDPSVSNVIAHNTGSGIAILGSTGIRNSLRANSFFGNGGLAIDLGVDGVTPNDAGDGDTGPNNFQNYPVITSVVTSAGHTIITGSLNTLPSSSTYEIDFYSSPAADSSGFGEGQTFLATLDGSVNGAGNSTFSFDLAMVLPAGSFVTAIASDMSLLHTSEFSQAVQVVEAPSITISDYSDVEQNGGTVEMFFSVHRTGDLRRASSFVYTTANGSATAPADYSHVPATVLTFAPGEAERTISVLVNGDTIDEPDETFFLNLSSPVNATIGDAQAVGTIFDDDADLSPPAVLTSAFNFIGFLPTPYEVQFQLNEPVVASPGGVPVLIRRVDNGQLVATVMASIQNGSVVFGEMTTPLADGNYRATLPAGAVIDLAGNPFAQDVDVNFFILAADANRDRTVDLRDLYIVSLNWLGTGKTFGEGDFNYDGAVNKLDLTILSQRWQVELAPPAAPSPALTSARSGRTATRTVTRVIDLVQ